MELSIIQTMAITLITALMLAALSYKDSKTFKVENGLLLPYLAWIIVAAYLFYDPQNPVLLSQFAGALPYAAVYIANIILKVCIVFAVFIYIKRAGYGKILGGADIKLIAITAIAYPLFSLLCTVMVAFFVIFLTLIAFRKKEKEILKHPFFSFFTISFLIVQIVIIFISNL